MGMTEEERFRLDLAGFFVRQAILSEEEISYITEQLERIHHDPDSLPREQRCVPGGPSSVLIDHPKIVDVAEELVGPGVRLENMVSIWRDRGDAHGEGLHSGGLTQADPLFGYRVQNGRIYSGLLRVAIEFGAVGPDDGGTQFLVGSHKSNFPTVPEHESIDPDKASPFLMSYECVPGSAVFWTEAVAHAGPPWRAGHSRVAAISTYSNVSTNFHRLSIPGDVIAALPRERQAYFREVWGTEFMESGVRHNSYEEFLRSGDETMNSAQ